MSEYLDISQHIRVFPSVHNTSERFGNTYVCKLALDGRARRMGAGEPPSPTIQALPFPLRLSMSPGIALRPHDARQQAQGIPHDMHETFRTSSAI